MRNVLKAVLAAALPLFVLACGMLLPCPSAHAASPSREVVIVLAPYLAWTDLSPSSTPAIWRLARDGAVGNMNTQVGGYDGASVEDGALTLSAANWARTPQGTPSAFDRAEMKGRTFAIAGGDIATSSPGAIVYTGFSAAQKLNEAALAPASIGTLGQNVHFMGARTAAVGNSDEPGAPGGGLHRPAALVAMDDQGIVDSGTVSATLLVSDATAPFGVRTDAARLFAAMRAVLVPSGKGQSAPAVVVLDTGDLLRTHDAAPSGAALAGENRRRAVALLDATVAQVRRDAPIATVMVLAPVTQRDFWSRPALAPVIVGGGDPRFADNARGPGMLSSPTTKRLGLVSNLDVASTVLQLVAGDAGGAVAPLGNGAVMTARFSAAESRSEADRVLSERVRALSAAGTAFLAIDAVQGAIVWLWVLAAVGVVVLAAVAATTALQPLRSAAQVGLLLVACVPAGSVLASWLPRFPPTSVWYVVSLAAWTLSLFAIALGVRMAREWRAAPVAFVAGITALLVVSGQLFGAHGPYGESTLFGYSVLTGWRYYGAGNEISAIAIGCALLAAGLLAPQRWRLVALAAAGGVSVAVLALVGAQAGVAVWGTAGVLLACAVAAPGGLRARNVAAAMALAVLVAVALIAIDALTGGTHVARLVSATVNHGSGTLLQTVQRKAIDAWNFSRTTTYTLLAFAAAIVLAWLRGGKRELLPKVLARDPGLSAALMGSVVAGAIALVTEDSGTSMPALLWGFAAFAALYAALALPSAAEASGTMAESTQADENGT